MFKPDFQVEAIKSKAFRPPKDWSRRGEMTSVALSILRQTAEPLTTRDIALQLLVERALDKNDQKLLPLMTKRVGVALRLQREKAWPSARKAGAVLGLANCALNEITLTRLVRLSVPAAGKSMFSLISLR